MCKLFCLPGGRAARSPDLMDTAVPSATTIVTCAELKATFDDEMPIAYLSFYSRDISQVSHPVLTCKESNRVKKGSPEHSIRT